MDRRLRGVHLRPHRRVDAVGADEQRAVRLGGRAVGVFDERGDAAGILAVAGDRLTEPDRTRPQPLDNLVVQQHVKRPRCTAYCGQL